MQVFLLKIILSDLQALNFIVFQWSAYHGIFSWNKKSFCRGAAFGKLRQIGIPKWLKSIENLAESAKNGVRWGWLPEEHPGGTQACKSPKGWCCCPAHAEIKLCLWWCSPGQGALSCCTCTELHHVHQSSLVCHKSAILALESMKDGGKKKSGCSTLHWTELMQPRCCEVTPCCPKPLQ